MARKGERLLVCPDCQRRGVGLRLGRGDDRYSCRYCDFYTYANAGDRIDLEHMRRLKWFNPSEFGAAS